MNRLAPLFCCLALTACLPPSGVLSLAPADGQTGLGVDVPVQIRGAFAFPDDQPPPNLISVIDLAEGGFVDGEVTFDSSGLQFTPTLPWRQNASYLWTVGPDLDDVRRPDVPLPDGIVGSATFSTSGDITILGAYAEGEDVCVLTSRPVRFDEVQDLVVTIDGERIDDDGRRIVELIEPTPLLAGDRGLGLFCIDPTTRVSAGQTLRILDSIPGSAVVSETLAGPLERLRRETNR